MSSAERVRRWRARHPQPGDDAAERQAVSRALDEIISAGRDLLARPSPDTSNKLLVLWRLGIEQYIAGIERYRDEVRGLLR
jgi:hypothetical protein